ncbi:uncharacterized protein EI90DRAFT_3117953 [Cantharellus anzutake]|uniref:uncharacterized protein n=1 Tax=Cantharellus anzutake TaxID=1750568 RepID=UPI0019082319|nr:uncharacterized protein EI90DRAFT_3117953 [Cantharellus anzutake]KAF8338888.1 hypothetical protein EI90DRAFT_3117953 [Cantharellus anzutake]
MNPEAIRNKINLENGNLVIGAYHMKPSHLQCDKTRRDSDPSFTFSLVANLTILIWDWLICLDRERRHFWGSKPNTGTVLYFLLCGPLFRTVTSLSALNIAVVQVILTMRTYALYSCNKVLLWALLVLVMGGLLNQVVFMWLGPWTAPYTGCLIRLPTWSWERLVPVMVFEILSIVLFAIKFCFYVKMGSMGVVQRTLFRDGFIGFLATSSTNLYSHGEYKLTCRYLVCTSIGLLVQILRPRPLLTFGIALTPLIPTLVAAHMLLNIKSFFSGSQAACPNSSATYTTSKFPATQRKGADSGGKDHYDDEDDEDDDDGDGDGDDGDNRRDRRGYHGFGNADSLGENWYEMKARPSETRYDPRGTASLSLSGRNPAPSEGAHPASPVPVALSASTSVILGNEEAAAGSSVGGPYLPQERTYPLRAGGRRLETTLSQRSEEGDVIDIQ